MADNDTPLSELVEVVEAPHPEEDVPAWAGAMLTRCDTCGNTDNHPKKVAVHDFGTDAEREERHHHDCHALATNDPHSVEVVRQAEGAKGHELRVMLFGDPDEGTDPVIDPTTADTAMSPAAGTEA